MSKIIIDANTSYEAEFSTKALLKGGFVAQVARISYNIGHGLPDFGDEENYPLILEGNFNRYLTKIHVNSVPAGYGGSGPHAMVAILKEAGFQFDEDDILTDRCANSSREVKLVYYRR